MEERTKTELIRIFNEYEDTIIKEWLKAVPGRFKSRPEEEIKRNIRLNFHAYQDILKSGDHTSLNKFVKQFIPFYVGMGFGISEPQENAFLFKKVLLPILKREYKKNPLLLIDILSLIDSLQERLIRDLSEEYQRIVSEDLKKRTQELEEAHKELKSRYEELEKFTKVAVDREERMAELKERIRQLETQIEKGFKRMDADANG